eukprot:COSAG06_NODE_61474_length_267_cov_1.232143_1_plen_77_part_01
MPCYTKKCHHFTKTGSGQTQEGKQRSKRDTRFLTDPPESAPAAMRNPGQPTGGGYHVLDYTFFWANVRANVKERVDA